MIAAPPPNTFDSWCDLDFDARKGLWIASLFLELPDSPPRFVSVRDYNPLTALACCYEHANDVWMKS